MIQAKKKNRFFDRVLGSDHHKRPLEFCGGLALAGHQGLELELGLAPAVQHVDDLCPGGIIVKPAGGLKPPGNGPSVDHLVLVDDSLTEDE